MRCFHIGLALLASSALCGCATEYPHVDAAFGHAYSALVHGQTFDPLAAARPHAPAPADGARLENVIKAHRGAVSSAVTGKVETGQFQTGGGG